MLLRIIFIAASLTLHVESEGDYYWRPWTPDSPPEDAVTAKDHRGVSYIVEAYVPNLGIYVGQAFINQHQINVSAMYSTTKRSHALKVLCSRFKETLAWYTTSENTFKYELQTTSYVPVIGGHDVRDNILYIGRYVDTYNRTVYFGSICGYHRLHYIDNNFPRSAKQYVDTYSRTVNSGSIYGNHHMPYTYNNFLRSAKQYEVLIIDNKKCHA